MAENAGTHYDVAVIGAGGAGDPLARALAEAGRRVALIEKDHLGGTCTNRGCTPSKALEASARVAHQARMGGRHGVGTGVVRVDLKTAQARKRQIMERFRRDTREQMDAVPGLELLRGAARFVGPHELQVTGDGAAPLRLTADTVVIDTGSRPLVPDIEGLSSVPFLTSDTLLEADEAPEDLVVLGGNYIGLELGQTFRRFGSRVTIVEADPHLLPGEDEDVSAEVERFLRAEGIDVLTGRKAVRVERRGEGVVVYLEGGDGSREERRGSHLLVATGRAPNTDALDLAAAGVETDERGHVRVDERLRSTSVPHVWAAGDAAGSPQFNHIAYDDFKVLHSQLLGDRERTTEGRLVPYAVYTDPPLGRVGVTEREARESGASVRVAKLPMAEVAHAIEIGEEYGLMKAVVDAESGRILGAAVLGVGGPEAAGILQTAMLGDLPWNVFAENPFAHPSLGDSLGDLFRSWQE